MNKIILIACLIGVMLGVLAIGNLAGIKKIDLITKISKGSDFSTISSSALGGGDNRIVLSKEFSRFISDLLAQDIKWNISVLETGHKCLISSGVHRINVNPKTGEVYLSFPAFSGRDLYLKSKFNDDKMVAFSNFWRNEVGNNIWLLGNSNQQ